MSYLYGVVGFFYFYLLNFLNKFISKNLNFTPPPLQNLKDYSFVSDSWLWITEGKIKAMNGICSNLDCLQQGFPFCFTGILLVCIILKCVVGKLAIASWRYQVVIASYNYWCINGIIYLLFFPTLTTLVELWHSTL